MANLTNETQDIPLDPQGVRAAVDAFRHSGYLPTLNESIAYAIRAYLAHAHSRAGVTAEDVAWARGLLGYDEDCDEPTCGCQRKRRILAALTAAQRPVPPATAEDVAGRLWSAARTLIEQGRAIQQDEAAGKYPTYEHLAARVDEAARERVPFLAALTASHAPDGLRPEVLAFARLMEAKLRKHDATRGQSWKGDDPHALELRMLLGTALLTGGDIAGECADVANFCMMIADRCGLLYTAALGVTREGE